MPRRSTPRIVRPRPTVYRRLPKKLQSLNLSENQSMGHGGFPSRLDAIPPQAEIAIYCGVMDSGQSTSVEVTGSDDLLALANAAPSNRSQGTNRIRRARSSSSEVVSPESSHIAEDASSWSPSSNPTWESLQRPTAVPYSQVADQAFNQYHAGYHSTPSLQEYQADQVIDPNQGLLANNGFTTAISGYYPPPGPSNWTSASQNIVFPPVVNPVDELTQFYQQTPDYNRYFPSNLYPRHDYLQSPFHGISEPQVVDSESLFLSPSPFLDSAASWYNIPDSEMMSISEGLTALDFDSGAPDSLVEHELPGPSQNYSSDYFYYK